MYYILCLYLMEMLLDNEGGPHGESIFMMSLMYGIALLFQLIEVGCYIIFYNHLYIHDTSMLKNSIISSDAYRNRQRTNIFSMGGQLCCFFAELIFVANMIVWINVVEKYNVTSMKEIYFVFKIYEFGFLSTVQVLSSKELRSMLISCIV